LYLVARPIDGPGPDWPAPEARKREVSLLCVRLGPLGLIGPRTVLDQRMFRWTMPMWRLPMVSRQAYNVVGLADPHNACPPIATLWDWRQRRMVRLPLDTRAPEALQAILQPDTGALFEPRNGCRPALIVDPVERQP
jgi:hypothetical protein